MKNINSYSSKSHKISTWKFIDISNCIHSCIQCLTNPVLYHSEFKCLVSDIVITDQQFSLTSTYHQCDGDASQEQDYDDGHHKRQYQAGRVEAVIVCRGGHQNIIDENIYIYLVFIELTRLKWAFLIPPWSSYNCNKLMNCYDSNYRKM